MQIQIIVLPLNVGNAVGAKKLKNMKTLLINTDTNNELSSILTLLVIAGYHNFSVRNSVIQIEDEDESNLIAAKEIAQENNADFAWV